MHKTLILFFSLFIAHTVYPQTPDTTSVAIKDASSIMTMPKKSFFSSKAMRITFAPTLFFVASAATWNDRENIREIRNRYIPEFKNGFDDYMQYIPAATTYGLKLSGVKGRNNWGRTALSHATSLAIMGILVNSIKYTARVQRPDNSGRNSFPSGHTAMAFTNATFMHKEYGLVHPLYSIGAYGSASLTAVGRSMNNKHWISDVLAGAGIGILSTQLGYFFIDKFYKNSGDNVSLLSRVESNYGNSFLALKLGYASATTNLLKEMDNGTKIQMGFEVGIEGSYFFNKHWGIGGDFTFTSFPISISDLKDDLEEQGFKKLDLETQSLGFLSFGIGPSYNLNLSKRWTWQLKSTAGLAFGSKGSILLQYNNSKISPREETIEVANYKPKTSMRFTLGTAFSYKIKEDLGLTYYLDYSYMKPKIDINFIDVDKEVQVDQQRIILKESIHSIASGFRLTAYF